MASFSLSLTPPFIKSHFKGRIYYIVDWGWAQCNYDIQGYWESVLSCSQRHFVAAAVQHFPKLIFALIRCWRPKVCSARGFGQNWPVEMEGQAKKKMAKSECGENGKVRAKWRKVSRCYWPLADGELWMPARWIFDAPKWASCSESGLKVATALMAKRWANWNSSSRPVGAFF